MQGERKNKAGCLVFAVPSPKEKAHPARQVPPRSGAYASAGDGLAEGAGTLGVRRPVPPGLDDAKAAAGEWRGGNEAGLVG